MTIAQAVEYKGYPIVGILPELVRSSPYQVIKTIADEHGDFVKVKFGPKSVYLVSNPDYVQHILLDNHKNYKKPELFYKGVRDTLGNGLVTSSGDFWFRQRRMMQPFFHRKFLNGLMDVMMDSINEVLVHWEEYAETGKEVDLYHQMAEITLNIITKTMFGSQMAEEDRVAIVEDMAHIVDYIAIRGYLSFLPGWMPLPGHGNFEEAMKRQRRVISEIIQHYRDNPSDEYNLVNMLLQAVDEETDDRMTDQQLFDEVISLFQAGFETSATMMTWLFYMLHEHPDVYEKAAQEVNSVIGDRTPELGDLKQLTYCKQAIQETLRLRTVIPMLPRESIEPDTIGDYDIPADAMLLIFFSGLHQNPNVWENVQTFDPDRFSPENSAGRSQYAFLPFAGGPRICLGNEFAYMEGILSLAMILQRFDVEVTNGDDIEPKISAVLQPSHPINIRIKRKTD